MRLTLPAKVDSLGEFREFVCAGARACGVAEEEIGKLDLVIEEIVMNVARYAYTPAAGAAEVCYQQTGPGALRVEIADSGRPFNPLEADPPDLSRGLGERPIGGLGVFLIRSIAGSIAYRREADRNVLSFQFPSAAG